MAFRVAVVLLSAACIASVPSPGAHLLGVLHAQPNEFHDDVPHAAHHFDYDRAGHRHLQLLDHAQFSFTKLKRGHH